MFFNLARSLGSLTVSPIQTALYQARRQAQRFEAGGVARADHVGDANRRDGAVVLPAGVDSAALAAAIEARLRAKSGSALIRWNRLVMVGADGRLRVPHGVIQTLGDGSFDRGRRFLGKLISTASRPAI